MSIEKDFVIAYISVLRCVVVDFKIYKTIIKGILSVVCLLSAHGVFAASEINIKALEGF